MFDSNTQRKNGKFRFWLCLALELCVAVVLGVVLRSYSPESKEELFRWHLWFLAPLLLVERIRPFVIGLGLFCLMYVRGKIIHLEWMDCLLFTMGPLLIIEQGRSAWMARYAQETRQGAARDNPRKLAPALILFGFAILYLFSSAAFHNWFYFLGWRLEPGAGFKPLTAGTWRFALLTTILMPFLLFRRRKIWMLTAGILFLSQAACFCNLTSVTGGAPLYRDDHPSFIFRLWEFGQTFPQLTNYNTYWNGGAVDFVGVISGVGAIGLPFWPVWRWASPLNLYTYVIGITYVVAMPLLAVASLRIIGASRLTAFCAGILALGVSRHFFLWMLHFGTVGAVFASFFVLPVSACLYRITWAGKTDWKSAVLLIVSAFFLVQWPPGAMMCCVLGLGFLASWRRWTVRKIVFLVVCAAAVIILQFKPFLTVFFQGNSLMDYVEAADGAHASLWTKEINGWKYLLALIHEGHPILIFLGLCGIFVLPHRSVRRMWLPVISGFALLAGWGPEWKPHLQLGRMAIPMFFVAIVPASLLVEKILKNGQPRLAIARAAMVALLILTGWNVARLYGNEGAAAYVTPTKQVNGIVSWIKENTPPDGRVLFAGSSVHAYGGGHVAALPLMAGREMMGCDYYHFPVGTIEYEYPPAVFRKPEDRVLQFLELYNVTAVITFRDNWIKYFRAHPEHYEEALLIDEKVIFKVKRASSLFLKGSGKVEATFNRLNVKLNDPNNDAVLKYNWVAGLKTKAPVEIYRFDAGDGVDLIGVHPHGEKEFAIRFGGGLW